MSLESSPTIIKCTDGVKVFSLVFKTVAVCQIYSNSVLYVMGRSYSILLASHMDGNRIFFKEELSEKTGDKTYSI